MAARTASLVLGACAVAAYLSACRTSRSSSDAGTADVEAVAPPAIVIDSGPPDSAAPDPILGEWERQTEPYKGMRVAIRTVTPLHVVVTTPPPVTPERLSSQARSAPVAKAQLECQRSLWKAGEELVTDARAGTDGGFEATILVRDWGFTGTCRHADSRAPARLAVRPDGALTIAVTRGKTVTQEWVRVGD